MAVSFSSRVDVVDLIDDNHDSVVSSSPRLLCSQRVSSSTSQGPCHPRVLASDYASGHHELSSINSIDESGQRHQPSEAGDEGKVNADASTACVSGSSRPTASTLQRGSRGDLTQEQGPANYNNIGVRQTEE